MTCAMKSLVKQSFTPGKRSYAPNVVVKHLKGASFSFARSLARRRQDRRADVARRTRRHRAAFPPWTARGLARVLALLH